MPARGGSAHVATINTKGKGGKLYTSHLLRRSYREGGKVRHENLGNLSHLEPEIIDAIRAMLAGRRLVDLDADFEIERSLPHGHVAVGERALDLEVRVEVDEPPPGEHRADRIDDLGLKVGEVAEVLVANLAALAVGAAQEVRGVELASLALRIDCGYVS